MKIILSVLIFFISLTSIIAQFSGVRLNTDEAQESYTLYCDDSNTYVINNCGSIVNSWPFGRNNYHLHPKLLKNGNLIALFNDFIDGITIKEYNWSGSLLAGVKIQDNNIIHHYEVIKLDNGNYLTAGREVLSLNEISDLGYQVGVETASGGSANPSYMDMILEVDPQGNSVWKWNIKDHMIQERDPGLPNYGIIAEHPELLDMDGPLQATDWSFTESFMINSFDYNADLDQIAISVRKMSEIIIIDHSTTTEEAAGSTGGNSGKGGDILWRWGNPENYGQGNQNDRQLYYQHNPNWIEHGPYTGMLTCYNNGRDRPISSFDNRYSNVPIIDTKINSDGSYNMQAGSFDYELVNNYLGTEEELDFYSSYTSGAKVLPNGNIHITVGQNGQRSRMLEVTQEGDKVWDYEIEDSDYIYRSEKYSIDHPAFVGKDLSVKGQIESNYNCELYTATVELAVDLIIHYDVFPDHIAIQSGNLISYTVIDATGKLFLNGSTNTSTHNIDISRLTKGIYFLTFVAENRNTHTVKFLK